MLLSDIPEPTSYDTEQATLASEQAGLTRAELAAQLQQNSEAVFDPETAVPPVHRWVDRGLVMSCEGATHPSHRHFKIKR